MLGGKGKLPKTNEYERTRPFASASCAFVRNMARATMRGEEQVRLVIMVALYVLIGAVSFMLYRSDAKGREYVHRRRAIVRHHVVLANEARTFSLPLITQEPVSMGDIVATSDTI